jgi:proteasome lid subunit RPN8/RPN11
LTLRVPAAVMDRVRAHLEAGYPNEACGALAGRLGTGDNDHEVVEFHAMRNTVADRPWDRYTLDPLEQLRVQKDAESRGLEIIGFVHSHPDHPPVPSVFDTEHAWPFYSYVVASVQRGRFAESRSWRLDEAARRFREEPLELQEG